MGASCNIVTKHLVFMLHVIGLDTGTDVDKLFALRPNGAMGLAGEQLNRFVIDAGMPLAYKSTHLESEPAI
jgi:hypothetical protein